MNRRSPIRMNDREFLELLINLGNLNEIEVDNLSDTDISIILAEYHLKVPQ